MCFSVLHYAQTRDWILPLCDFLFYIIQEPETEYFLYVIFCFTWYRNQRPNTSLMWFSVLHDTGVDPTQWCLVFLCAVNVGQATFEALAQIVRRVHELLEDKNDHNGRNSVLASYIQYCCTLPHQGLLHQCWFNCVLHFCWNVISSLLLIDRYRYMWGCSSCLLIYGLLDRLLAVCVFECVCDWFMDWLLCVWVCMWLIYGLIAVCLCVFECVCDWFMDW